MKTMIFISRARSLVRDSNEMLVFVRFQVAMPLYATNREAGSSPIPPNIIRKESSELADIPRYFVFCPTPSECGVIKHRTRVFFFKKKHTDGVLNDLAL